MIAVSRAAVAQRKSKRIADAWGEDLLCPILDYRFDDRTLQPVEIVVRNFGARIEHGAYVPTPRSDTFEWLAEYSPTFGRPVLRSTEEASRLGRQTRAYYGARQTVERAAAEVTLGRISVSRALDIVRRATEDVLQAFAQRLGEHWAWFAEQRYNGPETFWDLLEAARTRRDAQQGRPEFVREFKLSQAALDRIGRTGAGRWHVALEEILRAAILVDPFYRPGIAAIVAKAREFAGGVFPDVVALEADLCSAAGARLGRLTHRPRGGGGKRAIGSVIDELLRQHTASDEDLVYEIVRTNPGIAGDVPISERLGIRRDRVSAARRALVATGRVQNRGRGRRVSLFVPFSSSSPRP